MVNYTKHPWMDLNKVHPVKGKVIAKFVKDDGFVTMYAKMSRGGIIYPHKHANNTSIIYILKGTVEVITDDKTEIVKSGQSTICYKGSVHGLKNIGKTNVEFFGVVYDK